MPYAANYYAAIVSAADPIVMWSKPIVLSSNYCKNERGIVGELGISYYGVIYFDELSSYWEIPTMMSWVIFVNFLCINRAGFVQDSTCVLILKE